MEVSSPGAGRLNIWQACLFAILVTATTFGLRFVLDGPLSGQPTLVIFTLPIMLSAYVGGLRAGLLATAVTFFAASYYLLPPINSFAIASGTERWQQFFVALAGILISGLSEALHRARRRANIASHEYQEAEERARAALTETNDLRAALDEHAIVAVTDRQGKITFVNDKFCTISQYSREELLGQDHRLINSGFHSTEFIRDLWTTITHGKVWHGEIKNKAKDGSFYWVDTTLVPFLNATGRPRQYIAIRADITARKRAEAAVQASEEYFRFLHDLVEATQTLAEPAQIMTVIARMLGTHLHASRCAYAEVDTDGEHFTILHDYTDGCPSTMGHYQLSLFGAQAVTTLHGGQTLIIRNVATELLPGEGADMFNAIGIQAIITCPLIKEGGLRAMMAVHQSTPRDWQPGEIGLVQEVVERCWVTIERRGAEQKIRELNTGLEQRVAERTSQLQVANKELESFSYSVSHDLRAPLRGIHSFVGMIQEDYADRLDAEGNRMLNIVSSEAKRMGRLIDDLLAFSRLGRQPMKCTVVDMGVLALTTFESLVANAPPSAAVRFDLSSLPAARGDTTLLMQVFANLIGNAIKYSSRQPVPVIEVRGWSGNGESTYCIKDNGVGFDEKFSHNLFGVFQRLHSEQEFEGTGVGLAIVQRVIHRHGGTVRAESKPGKGAAFYFTLPSNGHNP